MRSEESVHVAVADALRAYGVDFFHPPNESKAHVSKRVRLRKMGLSKGVPDIVIVTPPPCGGYVAAALEIKSDTGRPTPEQKEWIERMRAHGWAAAIAKGLDACLQQLRDWGYLR